VNGYILFYRETLGISTSYLGVATRDLNVTLSGLKINTEYVFRVLAYNTIGNGIPTESYSFTTNHQISTGTSTFATLHKLCEIIDLLNKNFLIRGQITFPRQIAWIMQIF
jgi:Fibronectin type III domain.